MGSEEVRIGEKKIEVVVDDFAEFVARYTPFVSRDGVLVQTDEILPKGLDVELIFRLADGFVLIAGRGLVAWSRPASEELPAGIGLHFLVIEEDSKELVDRMVGNHVADGGKPFDVDRGSDDPTAGTAVGTTVETAGPAVDSEPTVVGRIPQELQRLEAQAPEGGDPAPAEVIREEGVDVLEQAGGLAFAPGMSSADEMKGSTRPEMPGNVSSLLDPSGKPEALDPAAAAGGEQHDLASALEDLEVDLDEGVAPAGAEEVSEAPDDAAPDDADLDDMLRELSEELGDDEEETAAEESAVAARAEEVANVPGPGAEEALDEEVDRALRAIRVPGEGDDEPRPSTQVMPPADMLEEEDATASVPGPEGGSSADLEDEVDLALDAIGPQESPDAAPPAGVGAGEPQQADDAPAVAEVELEPSEPAGVSEDAADDDSVELDFGPGLEEEESDATWAAKTLEDSSVGADIDLLGEDSEIDLDLPTEGTDSSYELPLALEMMEQDEGAAASPQSGPENEADSITLQPPAEEESGPPQPVFDETLEREAVRPDSVSSLSPTPTSAPSPAPTPTPAAARPTRATGTPAAGAGGSESFALRPGPATDYRPSKRRRRRRQQVRLSSLVPLILLLVVIGGLYLTVTRVFSEEYALLRGFFFGEDDGPVARVSLEDGLQIQAGEARPLRDLGGAGPRVAFQEDNAVQRPVTVIENVMWEREPDATVIDLWGNGVFAPSAVGYLRIDGERPREVLKIRGITRPFWQSSYRLQTPEVRRLRFGFHLGTRVSEVHMVIDLSDPRFRVTDLVSEGNRLMIRVAR